MEIKDITRETDGEIQEIVATISASAEEVNTYIDDYFKELGKNTIAGFRKGKAPREVIEKNAGGHAAVYAAIAENIVNEGGPAILDDADVLFISQPQFNLEKAPEENHPFTFTVSAHVPPLMELEDYGPVEIQMPPEKATDAEIDLQIEELRNVYYKYEEIEDPDYEAKNGDFVTVRMTCSKDGTNIGGLTDVERMIGLGEGTMPKSFDEHLVGAKAAYQLDFDFDAGEQEEGSVLGDGKLHAFVEVKGIRKKVLPDFDDEFFAKVGAANLDDLKKQMRLTIDMQKEKELPKLMEERVVDALVNRLKDEVPDYYVEFLREDVGRELMQSLQKDGTNLSDWMLQNNVEAEKLQNDVKQEAISRARHDIALESLFKEKGWKVTDEDIQKELAGDEDPAATLASLQESHRMADLRKMCRQSMAARWLMETAEVSVVE